MFRIYYDVTKSGAHYGCQLENEKKYVREIEQNKLADLIAYFEVQLNDDVDINIENLNKIIEEGFNKIGVLSGKKQYDETVTNGTFKLLTDKENFNTSEKVKKQLSKAISDLIIKGKILTIK
jgi:hypothetical protein